MFKWVCLGVAVAALSAFGWMVNDIRLEVQALAEKADRLAVKADELVEKTDAPRVLLAFLFAVSLHFLLYPYLEERDLLIVDAAAFGAAVLAEQTTLVIAGRAYHSAKR